MHSEELIIKLYRKNGYRITPQRQVIFNWLNNDHTHPTAEEIYQGIKSQMPDISRSTIYNTLNELVELGELLEVKVPGSDSIRYDTNHRQHQHLYCVNCHTLFDIEQELVGVEVPDEIQTGFKIQRSQITYYGICGDCQK